MKRSFIIGSALLITASLVMAQLLYDTFDIKIPRHWAGFPGVPKWGYEATHTGQVIKGKIVKTWTSSNTQESLFTILGQYDDMGVYPLGGHSADALHIEIAGRSANTPQYKDLTGTFIEAYGNTVGPMNVATIFGTATQYGTGNASGFEIWARRPKEAVEGTTTSGQLVMFNERNDGGAVGLNVTNLGREAYAGIFMNSDRGWGYEGGAMYGIQMESLPVSNAGIRMPQSRFGHAGTLIHYGNQNYTYFDRGNKVFHWVIDGEVIVSVSREGIFFKGKLLK